MSISLALLFLTVALPVISYGKPDTVHYILLVCITLPVILLFGWIWYSTYYTIEEDLLKIKHGPVKFVIPIADVLEIRLNQKTPGLLKACLSFECIMIIYGKYKSVFISPVNSKKIIKILKEINNDIVLKNK